MADPDKSTLDTTKDGGVEENETRISDPASDKETEPEIETKDPPKNEGTELDTKTLEPSNSEETEPENMPSESSSDSEETKPVPEYEKAANHKNTESDQDKVPDYKATNGKTTNGADVVIIPSNGHLTKEDQNHNGDIKKDTEKSEENEEQKKEKIKAKSVNIFKFFRYAEKIDVLLMFLGTLGAFGVGASIPLNLILYGQIADVFIVDAMEKENATKFNVTIPESTLFADVSPWLIYYAILGCVCLFCGWVMMACWTNTAERQSRKIRVLFFKAVMRQSIGWFDTNPSGELATRMSSDIFVVEEGMGQKMAMLLQWFGTAITGFLLAFINGWQLTLVILALSPLIIICVGVMGKIIQTMTAAQQKSYAKAGAIAEEVLSSIRTVAAFGGEVKESERYSHELEGAKSSGLKRVLITSIAAGITQVVIFSALAVGLWYGTSLLSSANYTGGQVLQVFMSALLACLALGNAAPFLEIIGNARTTATYIYDTIDLKSEIDSNSNEGLFINSIHGNIDYENIDFSFPSRTDVQVLHDFSLSVKVGQTVALVGSSGCGKSTTVQLLQRFYDPQQGTVKVDGKDIKELNVKCIRQQIGVVSQEPVLFGTTIEENIRYGKEGLTLDQIQLAAKEANIHEFIMTLPLQYQTMVGQRGAQLSGGQKQRIAIARALVKNPKILLLDEATSALDTESESVVQEALDKASEGRTTIVIAHRLSTVRNANMIVGIKDGRVEEMGTHDELMEKEGLYHRLVTMQNMDKAEEETIDLDEDDDETDDVEKSNGLNGNAQGSMKRKTQRTFSENSKHGEDVEIVQSKDLSLKELLKLARPEACLLAVGCASAVIFGCIIPSFSVTFGTLIGNFAEVDTEKQSSFAGTLSGAIVGIAFVAAISTFLQNYCFGCAGERLTERLRQMAFTSMLRQDMAWYDDPANQVGALSSLLATEASLVKGAAGGQLGIVIQSLTTISAALLIALIIGWKMALVIISFFPLILISSLLSAKQQQNKSKYNRTISDSAGKIASEAIDNIRTVVSLGKEEVFIAQYDSYYKQQYKTSIRKNLVFGVIYGVSQSMIIFAYAASFAYGSHAVEKGDMTFENVFRVFVTVIFGAMTLGRASAFAPDYSKGKQAAMKLLELFHLRSNIDSSNTEGLKMDTCQGNISMVGLKFNYPTRPKVPVLQNLTMSINQGQTVALIGSSGCGKSTTIQLIERFYDSRSGSITLDGTKINSLNLQWLRSQIGLVSQEPVLFAKSIQENIAYGDNTRNIEMDEIIEAAKKANIHNFITTLPLGYETNVGDKGTQLSGGQKQRIAIARALIRNPKILLLDEATSALDTESEKVVQDALDKAREGRTCVIIAHRLSTIQTADHIVVLEDGYVVEEGTHSELIKLQGVYHKLKTA